MSTVLSKKNKKIQIENVCVSMDDLHEIESVQCTLCINWLSVQYNNKKIHFGFFIQLRWARCDLYYIFTVTDRFRPKNKYNTGAGGNGSHSSGSGTRQDFPPVFSWDWDGKRLFFVGVGRERFENSLPCHPLVSTFLRKRT